MSRKNTNSRSWEQWRKIIKQQESSGESVSKYCRQKNINEKTFYARRKRLGLKTQAEPQKFIEVKPMESGAVKSLSIQTPNGYRLEVPEGMDGAYVRGIVAVLG